MELKRTLSLFDSTSLMVTSMIGSGIFFTTGYMIHDLPNAYGILIAWFLGGIFALSGALSYAYPATLYPEAGGDYIYLREAFSPSLAFMSGWASLLANLSANVAVLALLFSQYFLSLFAEVGEISDFVLFQLGFIEMKMGPLQIIACSIILIFTFLNIRGIKYAIRVQNTITLIKIGGLIFFISLAFLVGRKDFSNFQNSPSFSFQQLSLSMVPVTFSYLGWNMVTYVAGEVKDPQKNIPLSILLACIIVMLIYISMNFVYLFSVSIPNFQESDVIGMISSKFLFGEIGKNFFSVFILWMVTGSLSSILMGGSRVYYAMAKDGLFFPSMAVLHPKYETPYKSLVLQGLYACLLVTIGNVKVLLYMITCAIFLLSAITVLTVFKFKKTNPEKGYQIPFFPILPILFCLGNFIFVVYLTIQSPKDSLFGILITLAGLPFFYLFKSKFKKLN
jgi:basic amino acid/polyamine antiporter, APA family